VVEVSKQSNGAVKVDKVFAVIDLREVVNPDNVKAQVEGAIVMALSAATKPGITLEEGKVKQSDFHDSPILHIQEIPKIGVHILAEGGKIKGVGEPGLPPFDPLWLKPSLPLPVNDSAKCLLIYKKFKTGYPIL
jgi:isoquinoline 1-oxidoreductase subunit beta